MKLAPFASDPVQTKGRRFVEAPAPTRSDYQRDRDRIIHSTAFRRLVYKTQVFLNHEGDLFRTRLTHSLEVAQLGRAIARGLQLNEDLVETIALAHDLGHTPFGHAGQDALNTCLKVHNPSSAGFEHNLQSLRVVDSLEERYPNYDGLNLTFETREGILKHCSARNARRIEAREPGGIARRFVPAADGKLLFLQASLEAQLTNLADEIAYNAHDIDDGVRSGLLSLEQLQSVSLFANFCAGAQHDHPHLTGRRLLFEAIRRMLSAQVEDVLDSTQKALQHAAPATADEARQCPALVCFSADMAAGSAELKRFLFSNLYRHNQVLATTQTAKDVIRDLFNAYVEDPAQMPPAYVIRLDGQSEPIQQGQQGQHKSLGSTPLAPKKERVVADYIAGMTDRFAAKEHQRLCGGRAFYSSLV